jgi:hypothetical protein
MTLRNNDTQSLKLWKKTIQRIAFVVNLVGAGTIATVLLDLINVKIVLKRGGREYVIAHENLQVLVQESMFWAGFEHALQKVSLPLSGVLNVLPLIVDLGAPINLFNDDELTIEVTSKTGWNGDYSSSESSIEIESREAIGVETAVPFIKTKSIQATSSRIQESLGDSVTSIMFMNTEASRGVADADKVFDSVIITSDKYNVSDNRGRLLSRRSTQFETSAAATLRKENFRYTPEVMLDNVTVTVETNGSNVVATKNYIVYRTLQATKDTIQRSIYTQNKHDQRNAAKLQAQINS